MRQNKRALALKLAEDGYHLGLHSKQGVLSKGSNGRLQIDAADLADWLNAHLGQEILLIMGPLPDEPPPAPRTCRTCGRDYHDLECPHCRATRIRLRGR